MRNKIFTGGSLIIILLTIGCTTTKKINKAISTKPNSSLVAQKNAADSIRIIKDAYTEFRKHEINFSTFNAKIKVESSGKNGKNPDITAVVKIIKDSAIWISLSATFLNVEVFRVLITKDSVFLINKQEKEIQLRSLDYLQEVTEIPFDYKTVENLIVGNPIFVSDSILSFKTFGNLITLSTIDEFFKNLLTLSSDNKLMLHSKMDDVDAARSRTAQITYGDYQNYNGFLFSTYREIDVAEKNKLNVKLNYKQYDFNKEVSMGFNLPKNYKRK